MRLSFFVYWACPCNKWDMRFWNRLLHCSLHLMSIISRSKASEAQSYLPLNPPIKVMSSIFSRRLPVLSFEKVRWKSLFCPFSMKKVRKFPHNGCLFFFSALRAVSFRFLAAWFSISFSQKENKKKNKKLTWKEDQKHAAITITSSKKSIMSHRSFTCKSGFYHNGLFLFETNEERRRLTEKNISNFCSFGSVCKEGSHPMSLKSPETRGKENHHNRVVPHIHPMIPKRECQHQFSRTRNTKNLLLWVFQMTEETGKNFGGLFFSKKTTCQ